MSRDEELSPLAAEMVAGMRKFLRALRAGPIRVRLVRRPADPADLARLREAQEGPVDTSDIPERTTFNRVRRDPPPGPADDRPA